MVCMCMCTDWWFAMWAQHILELFKIHKRLVIAQLAHVLMKGAAKCVSRCELRFSVNNHTSECSMYSCWLSMTCHMHANSYALNATGVLLYVCIVINAGIWCGPHVMYINAQTVELHFLCVLQMDWSLAKQNVEFKHIGEHITTHKLGCWQ